jgi:hypothetical protein
MPGRPAVPVDEQDADQQTVFCHHVLAWVGVPTTLRKSGTRRRFVVGPRPVRLSKQAMWCTAPKQRARCWPSASGERRLLRTRNDPPGSARDLRIAPAGCRSRSCRMHHRATSRSALPCWQTAPGHPVRIPQRPTRYPVARAVPDRRIEARGHHAGHPASLDCLPSPVEPDRGLVRHSSRSRRRCTPACRVLLRSAHCGPRRLHRYCSRSRREAQVTRFPRHPGCSRASLSGLAGRSWPRCWPGRVRAAGERPARTGRGRGGIPRAGWC